MNLLNWTYIISTIIGADGFISLLWFSYFNDKGEK
ncbi:hypothetical protein SRCM100730_01802 [Bacillus velezensis]|nr:hypothetical protein NG74_01217 [Bacillus velezensis]AMQ73634.1 hypothetical protein BAMY6614_09955 [Bacillus amyloliquefaciens UMAF6614]CUB28846.1 hypothetical protein BN2127_JRS5_02010 [Bacillus amyloliquefaciens]ATD76314.1 hypothetical protein CLI98_03092 [Bacillus velezensis]OBR33979.1 hypothetical protein SRCM100731_00952 [Bacillus velezensis]